MSVQKEISPYHSNAELQFELLKEAASLIQNREMDQARNKLSAFPALSVDSSPGDLKSFIFLKALWKNFETHQFEHDGNLYLKDFASQQIDIFNLMATRMPMVSLAVQTANDILSSIILQHQEVVLIDVGIGTGQQIVQLIQQMKTINDLPKHLKVFGIEPSERSLKLAEENIRALSSPYFKISFQGILGCAESLSDGEWEKVKRLGEVKVINEAVALHHVTSHGQGIDHKTEVLKKLRSLDPAGFVLSEPHSDHQSSNLLTRLMNAWRHFGLVFDIIDEQRITQDEKDTMKVHFFAREIEDILGNSETTRSERHESAEMWVKRLREANFRILSCDEFIQKQSRQTAQVSCRTDYVSLDSSNETVVAIIAASA